MELVNRFKTCQAGRKVTERNITYLYLKWQGESEVGTLSSKARTRRHQINLLSIRLKPKEMFYIRLKQKRCFMHTVKLQNAMHQVVVATGSFMWVQKASGHGKKNSDNTLEEKFRQYLTKWRLGEYAEEVVLCACPFLHSYLCTCCFSLWRKYMEFVWPFLRSSCLPVSTPLVLQTYDIIMMMGSQDMGYLVQNLLSFAIVFLS